jgi:NADPH2:quinone reductase
MKAIVLKKTGGPDVLSVAEVNDPRPGKGEVLASVSFAGINYAEILSRKGLYSWAPKRPYILGMECAGVIEAVGEGVSQSRIGERVMAGAKHGCYAEKIAVPEANAVPVPGGYSMEEGAAFLVNYMTAWVSLFKMARLLAGEKLLVTAAAGGVGTAAVRLASSAGAKVYGMAGSAEKCALVESLGAARCFNYRNEDCFKELLAESGGIDAALEVVGGKVYRQSLEALKPFGRIVVAGFASLDIDWRNPLSWIRTWRDIPRADIGKLAERSIAVMSSHLGYLLDMEPGLMTGVYAELEKFVRENDIRPVVGRVLPLERASEAHAYVESRKSTGKVLLRVGG